jgi:dTDP-4-dehydrorhamnose reductase
MKILLTGASGLVGSNFARAAARRGHHVVGVVGAFPGELAGLAEKRQVDLTASDSLTRLTLEIFPDVIVNAAAISEPAVCEREPARSAAMNVALPAQLAQLARHLSARLIHLSSEQVFDGTHSIPYVPDDPVAPINLYGRQKIESEKAVISTAPDLSAIIRAPLLMGNSPGGRRGVHERLLTDWSLGRAAKLYVDEFRQPCTAENLADVMLELVERPDIRGIFHWAGTESLSRFDLGQRIRDHFRLPTARAPLIPVTRAENPEVSAQRQRTLPLDISTLRGRLKTPAQSVGQQLATLQAPASCHAWLAASQMGSGNR